MHNFLKFFTKLVIVGAIFLIGILNVIFDQKKVLAQKKVDKVTLQENQISEINQVMSQQDMMLQKAFTQIQYEIKKNSKLTNQEFQSTFKESLEMKQVVVKRNNEIIVVTGGDGTAEFEAKQGNYLLASSPINSVDVYIPSSFSVSAGENLLTVGLKEGTGQIKKIGKDSNIILTKGQSKIKVVTYYDKNGNGVWDKDEKAVPWAGILVSLLKVTKEKTIKFNQGWNLFTLNALPDRPQTAAKLIQAINSQGGEAVTVSTLADGAWKSYVDREGKAYSGEDFSIELGKAYFIKTLKKSTFTFQGQDFVSPIELKLTSGWNTIGIPFSKRVYRSADFVDTANQKQVVADALSRWESGLWDTFVKKNQKDYGNNFIIENNRGYIIRVNQNSTFSP